MHSKKGICRWLLCLTAFIAFGALVGGVAMIWDKTGVNSGFDGALASMRRIPFVASFLHDLVPAGIALLLVNFIPQSVAFIFLLHRHPAAAIVAMVSGVFLMIWTGVQFFVLPVNALTPLYFVFGLMELILGIRLKRKDISLS